MVPNSLSICLLSLFIVTAVVFSDECPDEFCNCAEVNELKCSSRGIQELHIAQLPKRTFTLDLSDNQIRVIRRNSFPVSESVRRLDLKRNHIEYIEPGALAKFPNLVRLYLQVNQLKRIEKGTFQGLRKLKQLTLQVNQLKRIEKDTFVGLRNIRLVNISQNKLIDVHKDALSSFKKLKKISLRQNLLTTFKKHTFPNNSWIELDGNELICDCGMSWFITKSAHEKRGATESARCAFPKALAGKQLKKLGGSKWDCRAAEFELPGFNVAPSKNQVIFQNDSFQLTCSSLWQPRGQLLWKADRRSLRGASVINQHDVSSRKNKSILIINRAGLHHSGVYVCQAVIGNDMQTVKEVSISVIGWQTQFCPLQHLSTEKGKFSWHSTVSGATALAQCPFDTRRKARRKCTNGKWEEADIGNCFYKNLLTRKLDILSKREINQTSLPQIFYDSAYITKKHLSSITEKQLYYLFKIFAKIGAAKFPMPQQLEKEIRKTIANVFTSVVSMNDTVKAKSGANNKQTLAWLVPVIDKFMKDSLDRELQSKTEDVPVVLPVTTKLAAYSRSYTADFPFNLVCSVLFRNLTFPNKGTLGECSRSANTTTPIEGFDAQIVIPSGVFSLATLWQLINVTFIGFNSVELFGDSKLEGISSKTKNTLLNSAIIGIHVQVPGMKGAGIIQRIDISFKHFKPGTRPRLVYWSDNENSEKTQWMIDTKCTALKSKGGHSNFSCSELSGKMIYYAVIMEIAKETRVVGSFGLEFVTHVGASICAFFLLLTFLTYAAFRELRYNRNDAATLMNLCLALMVAIVLFVTGINRVENMLLCKAFSVLLHYFLLCCFLWVGCGGACMTVLVRKGPDKEEYNPVLKYYLIAWGIPMIVCGITLAGNAKNYDITNYCWLTSQASIGAFIIPGGLIVIINMIIFLRLHNLVNKRFPESIVNRVLDDDAHVNSHPRKHETAKHGDFHFPDRSELLDFVKGSLLVMLILCIDCGFVVMIFINRKGSSRYLYHLFSYGFAIANMILGLAVFIFHCVRREDVHICWRSLFKRFRGSLDEPGDNEIESLLEPLNHPVLNTPIRSNGRVSRMNSDHNNEHSDVISALSAAHSHFTHDIPSSRPSSIFGPSVCDSKIAGKQGFGKLTLPSYDNNKPSQVASESESAAPQVVPTAPPLPLTGFAPYPPSSTPDTSQQANDPSADVTVQNTPVQNTATPDFTITTVSERTFSDASNLHSEARSGVKQFEPLCEIVPSEHGPMPPHVDPALRVNQKACLPLHNIVAPNWKPVRRGGSTAVFYPYVDPGFKSLHSPGPNSLNSVLSSTQHQIAPVAKVEQLSTIGAFTIPQRSEVIGATNSVKPPSAGNQTDQEQWPKRQSDCEAKKHTEDEVQQGKVEKVRMAKTSGRRRRMRSRTRFDDLPVEKCLIYVPLAEEQEAVVPVRNETSV